MCACTWLMKLVVSRLWWSSLALIFQAWPHTLILRSSLRRGVNMRSQCPFNLCKGSTLIYTYAYDWIGLPLENWCMCVCIVWIRYLELIMESGRGSNPLMMAGGQKKRGDKEPATWRVPSSFECEARKALVPACHWSKAMIQGLWVPIVDYKTHKPTGQSLGWG